MNGENFKKGFSINGTQKTKFGGGQGSAIQSDLDQSMDGDNDEDGEEPYIEGGGDNLGRPTHYSKKMKQSFAFLEDN